MKSNVSPLASILKQGPNQPPDHADEADGASEYEAFANGRVGTRPQLMVVFRRAGGEVMAFSYISLTEIRSPNPEKGFTVDFSGIKVVIAGERLGRLFQLLCLHRAVEIVEADRSTPFNSPSDAPIVTTIMVSK